MFAAISSVGLGRADFSRAEQSYRVSRLYPLEVCLNSRQSLDYNAALTRTPYFPVPYELTFLQPGAASYTGGDSGL